MLKREQLKKVVSSIIRPKIVEGKSLNGNEFVAFLEKILEALNKGEIPSTGSLVEVFNKKILERCLKLYEDSMTKVILPISEDSLQSIHEASRAESLKSFDEQHFGCHHAKKSAETLDEDIEKMMGKSKSLFIKEYNHRLFNWLVAFSLVMVIVGRFIIKFILIEIGAWILFIFLETYTRMFWSPESLYYNPVWHGIVATWETLVYSPILDLDRWAIQIGIVAVILLLYWRCYGRRKHGSHSLLPLYTNSSKVDRSD